MFAISAICQTLKVEEGPLLQVLKKVEHATGWTFNFNPDVVAPFTLDHGIEVSSKNKHSAIQAILGTTALDFEIKSDVIILLPPIKKRYRICGNLHEKDSHDALAYAHVYLDQYQGCLTDEYGYFEIEREAFKNEKIIISYLGFIDQVMQVNSFKDGCQDVALEQDPAIFGQEVVIRDYLLSSISLHKEYAGINVNMNYAAREMGALERDVFKTIQFLPGITSLDETASNLTIRGSNSDQNLIIWEGAPIYDNGHLFGMISSINPFVINRLNVYKGVYHASYENRIGGVVDISLKEDIPSQFRVGIGTTVTETHAEIYAPLINKKLGLVLSGRKATTNLFDDNITLERYGEKLFGSSEIFDANDEEDDFLSDGAIDYYDINAKLIYRPAKKLTISSAVYKNVNSFDYDYLFQSKNIVGFDSLMIQSTVFSNSIKYHWPNQSLTELHATRSVYENDYSFLLDESQNEGSGFRRTNYNKISDFQLKLYHSLSKNKINLDFGYILDRKQVDFQLLESTQFEQDIQDEGAQIGTFHHAFLNTQLEHNNWRVDFGARASYLGLERSIHLAPRMSVVKEINNSIKLKLSAGVFNQYVRQVENFSSSELNIENKIWFLGTEDIMRSNKIGFGATFQKNNWIVDLDSYHHHSIRVPVLTAGQQLAADVINEGSITSSGLEILIKKRWNRLNSALSYHLSKTSFDFPSLDEESFPSNNDQRHNVSFLQHYQIKNWSVGCHYYLRSGLPYSEVDELLFIEEEDEEYYEAEIDEFNEQRLSTHHRMDLSLGYRKILFDKFNLELQFSLFNILDQNSATKRTFILSDTDTDSEEPEILEVEKHQLRRTPQFLLRITF